MTKKRIIEMTQEALSGGRLTDDDIGSLHGGLLATYLTTAFQQAIGALYRNETNELDPFTFIERNIKPEGNLLKLTYSPMLIKKNDGLRLVHPSGSPREVLWHDPLVNQWISDDLLGKIQNQNGTYDFTGREVYLSTENIADAYDVHIMPEFWSLEEDDEVPMPRRFEVEIINIVKNLVLNAPPQDIINDSR